MYRGIGKGAVNHRWTEGYCMHKKPSTDSREKKITWWGKGRQSLESVGLLSDHRFTGRWS